MRWLSLSSIALVTFGDSYTDENRLGYFGSHNGSAPPVGVDLGVVRRSYYNSIGSRTFWGPIQLSAPPKPTFLQNRIHTLSNARENRLTLPTELQSLHRRPRLATLRLHLHQQHPAQLRR
jgi:hypothetical protein